MDIKKVPKLKSRKEDVNEKNTSIKNAKKENVDKKDISKNDTGAKNTDGREDASAKNIEGKKPEKSDTDKKNIFKRIFKWPFSKLKPKAEVKIKARKINLKKINLKNINIKKVISKCGEFWFRHYRIIFALLFFLTFAAGIFFWYQKLYNSQWSEEKKQQYTASQKVEVNFRGDKFQDIVKAIENRKSIYESELKTLNNIFELVEEDEK